MKKRALHQVQFLTITRRSADLYHATEWRSGGSSSLPGMTKSSASSQRLYYSYDLSQWHKPPEYLLTCQQYPADQLVPADVVEVHHPDVQTALPDPLPGNFEAERLVVDRLQSALLNWSFPLLNPLLTEIQPDFDVGVWKSRVQ